MDVEPGHRETRSRASQIVTVAVEDGVTRRPLIAAVPDEEHPIPVRQSHGVEQQGAGRRRRSPRSCRRPGRARERRSPTTPAFAGASGTRTARPATASRARTRVTTPRKRSRCRVTLPKRRRAAYRASSGGRPRSICSSVSWARCASTSATNSSPGGRRNRRSHWCTAASSRNGCQASSGDAFRTRCTAPIRRSHREVSATSAFRPAGVSS